MLQFIVMVDRKLQVALVPLPVKGDPMTIRISLDLDDVLSSELSSRTGHSRCSAKMFYLF